MILVIMAAGMGSRYGGLKQLDPLGPGGEFILDYSVYDAKRAGFDKVVFVIKKENLELFRSTVGKRIEKNIKVEYAFQELSDIPEGLNVPDGREKPWGTGHAVWCARKYVNEPFVVINADDYYGRNAFEVLAEYLGSERSVSDKHDYCMVGYRLANTMTEYGTVSRGVCVGDEAGNLKTITEHKKIGRSIEGAVINTFEDGSTCTLGEDTIVSMNCWGFTPELFETIGEGLKTFFNKPAEELLKAEYYLPTAVQTEISGNLCKVKLLKTDAKWFGVTYREDRESVVAAINMLIRAGQYPERLWD